MSGTASYFSADWFALLQQAVARTNRQTVAQQLGVSAPLVGQVLNASGKYGAGLASCAQLAQRVLHVFGPPYECPFLTDRDSALALVDADYCRTTAHAAPPTASPQAMRHWQACRDCEHKPWSAPQPPRQPGRPRPRKTIPIQPCNPDHPDQSQHPESAS